MWGHVVWTINNLSPVFAPSICSSLTYLPEEPSFGLQASPGGGVFRPDWRGRRRHTVWQHGIAARQEAAQSYTHLLYTLASSSLPEVGGWWREGKDKGKRAESLPGGKSDLTRLIHHLCCQLVNPSLTRKDNGRLQSCRNKCKDEC